MEVLVAKDESTGATLAYDCEAKGPSDVWVMKQFARDLEDWGRRDIHFKTDGEPAIVAPWPPSVTPREPSRAIRLHTTPNRMGALRRPARTSWT